MATPTIIKHPKAMADMQAPLAERYALLRTIREGVLVSHAEALQDRMRVTQQQLAHMLNVTARTLQRYAPEKRLNPSMSEKVAYLEQLQDLGREVFGDDTRFAQWLLEEQPALNEAKPMAYLDTITGIEAVRQVLLRYQHGIF